MTLSVERHFALPRFFWLVREINPNTKLSPPGKARRSRRAVFANA